MKNFRNVLLSGGLKLIRLAAGRLGRDLSGWISDAEQLGLGGQAAFEYVFKKAKARYRDAGNWLLDLLIEALLAKQFAATGELAAKLKWPE